MKVVLWLLAGLSSRVVIAVAVLFCMGRKPGVGDTRASVEISRPPEGVGARETWIVDDPGMKRRMEIPSEVTEYDKPHSVAVRIKPPGL